MKALNDLSKKQKGDKVFDALGGEWTVDSRVSADVPIAFDRPIKVTNNANRSIWISEDGRTEKLLPPTFFAEPVMLMPYIEGKEYVTASFQTTVVVEEKCDFSDYEVGDEVYFEDGSRALVTEKCDRYISAGRYVNVPLNGKTGWGKQLFFHDAPRIAASNADAFRVPDKITERAKKKKEQVDWSIIDVDTLIEVKFSDGWCKRYFATVDEGLIAYWLNGADSKTAYGRKASAFPHDVRLVKD